MTNVLPWRTSHAPRHRAADAIRDLRHQLAGAAHYVDRLTADRDQLADALADRDQLIEALNADLTDKTRAIEAAGRRIAELTEAAQRAADLNANAIHVPAIGHRPIDAGDQPTQPMDCRELRATVGTPDAPRAIYRVRPLHTAPFAGLGASTNPAAIAGDTTQSIPITNAA